MIREALIPVLDFLLTHYAIHVRRKRARKLAIESAFSPRTCEVLLEACADRVELARQAIHVAMFTNDDPVAIIEDLVAIRDGRRPS